MAVPDVAGQVPAYAVWFASSGVLVAATRFLASRDVEVAETCNTDFEIEVGELNDHLSGAARLAQTITVQGRATYNTVRNRDDFDKLYGLLLGALRATRLSRITGWLTRAVVILVGLHVVTGIGATGLALVGVIGAHASDKPNVVAWVALTATAGAVLLAKAVILAMKAQRF